MNVDTANRSLTRSSQAPPQFGQALTQRETELVRYCAEGLTLGQMAQRYYVEESTVKTQLRRAYVKLGARDRGQCVMLAVAAGYIPVATAAPRTCTPVCRHCGRDMSRWADQVCQGERS